MDAVELVDRHLVLFEVKVGDALLEDANQQVMGELVLIREARTRDGLKSAKEVLIDLVAPNDGIERVVGELVVVAVVAECGRAFRKAAEIRLVLLFEECVLGRDALSDWFDVLSEGTT